MGEQKIGVMIISETHMSAAQAVEVEEHYSNKRLRIFNSEYTTKTSMKGIAIVLNRELTNIENVKIHYLDAGRAILAVLPWHGKRTLTVLGIYAPTESNEEKIAFWEKLTNMWLTTDLPVPDVVGGDFNLVPDAIDRQPHKTDKEPVVTAYLRFTRMLGLIDGWRQCNPDRKEYTYAGKDTLSRIDKILVSPKLMKNCREWEIEDVGTVADHRMVSMMVSAPGAPHIGKGRWAMPHFLVHDDGYMDKASEEVYEMELTMAEERTETNNAQTKFKSLKDSAIAAAKERAKTAVGATELKERALQNERDVLLNSGT
ncbi:Endonuclease/exonuclease/phosphatase, partial [Mycena haematopus]